MRHSLQWFVSPRIDPGTKARAFLGDYGAALMADVTYPDSAWQHVVNDVAPNPSGAPDTSAAISHAVMETAVNRRTALNATPPDQPAADMMTQRLLTLSQLRAAWLGQAATTDLVAIERQAAADSSIFSLSGLGAGLSGVLKLAALGVAAYVAVKYTRKRSA